jgi:hypothetical protein
MRCNCYCSEARSSDWKVLCDYQLQAGKLNCLVHSVSFSLTCLFHSVLFSTKNGTGKQGCCNPTFAPGVQQQVVMPECYVDARCYCRAREQARMEELFEKLQKKEEAIAKLEAERRRGRTTPATDADSNVSNPQSTHIESPAADGSVTSGSLSRDLQSPFRTQHCLPVKSTQP